VIDRFLSSMLKIFFILFAPSSSRHLIFMFCFSSCFLFFFREIALIASCFSFGMYFEISDSSFFDSSMNSVRSLKSFRIFSFTSASFSLRICLNATLIACDCLKDCITSFFSFEVTRLSERWTWSPSIFRILQTICLFGMTYCRISLIRPGAISDEMSVPCWPFGSFTNVIVFVTDSTLHNNSSPSFIVRKPWFPYYPSFKIVRFLTNFSVGIAWYFIYL